MVKLPHWPVPYGVPLPDENLSRMHRLLKAIGNPQNHLPPIIHIAGTNGKGSVLAFLRSILTNAGLRVSCYTSPHIARFNERIILNGAEIDDNFLYELIEETRIQCPPDLRPTFFEGTTAAAILAFSRTSSDFLLVECGMGGMLDATNIFPDHQLAIITPISLDHTEFLGDNVAEIAFHKAHIIKPGRIVIVGLQPLEALEIIKNYAAKIGAKIFAYEENFDCDLDLGELAYVDINAEKIERYALPILQGSHQITNAGTAIAAIKNLPNLSIDNRTISLGLSQANWPGRLENIGYGPLVDILGKNSELWIDGAHNSGGAMAMVEWLVEMAEKDAVTKEVFLIIGKSIKPDQRPFLQPFCDLSPKIFAIRVEGEPKPEKPENIASASIDLGLNCEVANDLSAAIEKISQFPGAKRVLICGSLYLQNDLRKYNKISSTPN